jgi:hypothetical protein
MPRDFFVSGCLSFSATALASHSFMSAFLNNRGGDCAIREALPRL